MELVFQITPSIFEEVNVGDNLNKIVDEYTYATLVDKDLAAQRLERLLKYSLLCFNVSHYYLPGAVIGMVFTTRVT